MNDFAKYDLKQSKRTTPALPLGLAFLRDIEIVPPKFLVESILPLSCLIAVVGASYTYKSFLMLDMALCVASGVPFMSAYDTPTASQSAFVSVVMGVMTGVFGIWMGHEHKGES